MGNVMKIKIGKEETYYLLVIAKDTKIPIYSLFAIFLKSVLCFATLWRLWMIALHTYHLSRQLSKAICALTNVCGGVLRVQTWSDLPRH